MHSFIEAAERIYKEAKESGRLKEGLSSEEIKEIAERQDGVVKTQFGSLAADSEPMSRSAPMTKNSVDHEFSEEEDKLAKQGVEKLRSEKIISLDCLVGDGKDGITVRFLMPEKRAQIAYGLKLLFGEPKNKVVEKPTYHVIFFSDDSFELNKPRPLTEKDIQVRLYMGSKVGEQVKICRNTTYTGEGKKGVFMFEDWRIKALSKTGIFLHAGVREDKLWVYNKEEKKWEFKTIVTAAAGLTATGKTTTLCRTFARFPGEDSGMISDDGGEFNFNGSFSGFELGGIYIKTDGLSHEEQPEVHRAATARDAFLENVGISHYPYIPDFHDISKTSNGRSIVTRKNLEVASESIRADKVDNIIILTRNPLVNVISKLTPEQATMQFIYGESVESSGGDPSKAGQFKREFFLDPFVAGDRLKHALIFYEFLKRNPHVRCYLANTDVIGQERVINDQEMYEKVAKGDQEILMPYDNLGLVLKADKENKRVTFTRNISLRQSLAAYNDVLRGQIKFSSDTDHLGHYYPVQCDRLNKSVAVASYLWPDKELLKKKVEEFLYGRRKYIEEFEKTYGEIPRHIRNSLPPYSEKS